MSVRSIQIALVGNPNSGKSSLFNTLTGLNQKVGNFPGVTVDKKAGSCRISPELDSIITDLPGTYSLYPRREDEWVAYKVLMQQDKQIDPEMLILVADASNLKRNLLFVSQIIDLKIPVVVALTMLDIAKKKDINVDVAELERELGVPVVPVNPRKNKGIPQLKRVIEQLAVQLHKTPVRDFINNDALATSAIANVKQLVPNVSDYRAIHYLINHESFNLDNSIQEKIENIELENNFNHTKVQAEEIVQRYQRISHVLKQSVSEPSPLQKTLFTEKLDDILLHRVWGYAILVVVLFLLFQSIFWLAEYPMNFIEWIFAEAGSWLSDVLPQSWWSDLFINGIVAGLSGILVFIPQIIILFGLINILEDTGYMARISFLTDKLMRKVGLNGKSVMPMISGFACAVPAVMSARNIENKKERLLTILVTPLMSCSARLPVYTILISLVIPKTMIAGFIGVQGLVMMGLYLLGVVFALLISYIAKNFIRIKEKSFFILELPVYRAPRWKNIFVTMIEKAKIFVFEAGKVIMIISLILWALSNFGPGEEKHPPLENSYAGVMGKAIEPAIRPLGFDWKIGIALITSFAAREVFVGTMATLYSVEDDNEEGLMLREKMQQAKFEDGSKVYTLATGVSLMIFYVFAMQCMSTLAIVKRETKS
ncbi:MAG: ferrous iron transport protein B, partial [Chitinophagaceae bacterium]|nr:ferrous iron transport protein B [Chitinophagaceae bacterium]